VFIGVHLWFQICAKAEIAMAETEATEITPRDKDKVFDRPVDNRHRFVLKRFRGYVLDVEDVHFHLDSAVFLPDYGDVGLPVDPSDQNHVSGLAALRSVYLHAEAHPEQKLIVIGHTDRSGPESYNVDLSQKRADNVLHVLLGQRAEWVALSKGKHKVQDYQQILKWANVFFGWECDPGKVDGIQGPKTKAATQMFQKRYNEDFDPDISVDGVVGPQTWGAFFDCYIKAFEILLKTDAAGVAAKRQALRFLDDGKKTVGCGESHPITENTVENRISRIDRRVEIIFFDPGEEPLLDCHPGPGKCKPDACEIYNPRFYKFEPLSAEGSFSFVVIDELGRPVANTPVDCVWADGNTKTVNTDDKGRVIAEGKGLKEVQMGNVHALD
jgi:outer membrane protein OmpA-like peptidoglycan-associated protein